MSPQWRIWLAGQGGQGVSFMADLLCRSALSAQLQAQARSDSEWAIRGGLVIATVLIHDLPFDASACPDFNWAVHLHPATRPLTPPLSTDAQVLDAYASHSFEQAASSGYPQGLNLLMLGQLVARTGICPPETVVWQLRKMLGREQVPMLPYDLDLFAQGLQQGGAHAGHS